jgi:rSAM/selenodomain-associated transferase 2
VNELCEVISRAVLRNAVCYHLAILGALRLGIVVPTLNEESALPRMLPRALATCDEVVVSDGGSSDATQAVASRLGARVVAGPPGRGAQLNRGAAATSADLLLFVHADTLLPLSAAATVRAAVAGGAVGGAFLLRFDDPRASLRLGSWLINQRTRLTHLPLGDQAHFVTRAAFLQLGGYREWPILEDLDFSCRLKRAGPTAIVADPVTTAARRFVQKGIVRTVANNWLIWGLYVLGVSPHRLARLYGHVR